MTFKIRSKADFSTRKKSYPLFGAYVSVLDLCVSAPSRVHARRAHVGGMNLRDAERSISDVFRNVGSGRTSRENHRGRVRGSFEGLSGWSSGESSVISYFHRRSSSHRAIRKLLLDFSIPRFFPLHRVDP